MTVDWTLRFSDIVSIGAFFFGGFSAILVVKNDMRALALKFGFLEETVKKETATQNVKIDKQSEEISRFGELLNLMGRYEERFAMNEERFAMVRKSIDELRHGRGFVVPPPYRSDQEG